MAADPVSVKVRLRVGPVPIDDPRAKMCHTPDGAKQRQATVQNVAMLDGAPSSSTCSHPTLPGRNPGAAPYGIEPDDRRWPDARNQKVDARSNGLAPSGRRAVKMEPFEANGHFRV